MFPDKERTTFTKVPRQATDPAGQDPGGPAGSYAGTAEETR
ncbi:hypothetical protein [Paracoccus sp. AK26]|nr:hypothetical protein [Paracoccus sp. AK26]